MSIQQYTQSGSQIHNHSHMHSSTKHLQSTARKFNFTETPTFSPHDSNEISNNFQAQLLAPLEVIQLSEHLLLNFLLLNLFPLLMQSTPPQHVLQSPKGLH